MKKDNPTYGDLLDLWDTVVEILMSRGVTHVSSNKLETGAGGLERFVSSTENDSEIP
jgi:hypothetical protein